MLNQIIAALGIPHVESEPKGLGITADIEMVPIQEIDAAYERMARSDVKYRFVIDMQSLEN